MPSAVGAARGRPQPPQKRASNCIVNPQYAHRFAESSNRLCLSLDATFHPLRWSSNLSNCAIMAMSRTMSSGRRERGGIWKASASSRCDIGQRLSEAELLQVLWSHQLHFGGLEDLNEEGSQVTTDLLEMSPRIERPPVLHCRCTSPSQAPASRPWLKALPVPIAATTAVAVAANRQVGAPKVLPFLFTPPERVIAIARPSQSEEKYLAASLLDGS